MLISSLLLFMELIASHISAQSSLPLRLESITIDQGLSQGYVTDITQDKKGFMWFATGDGLNKYDGYSFTTYHHDPDDTTSIGSDDLTCVFEDSQERLWIGTRHNGIDVFDREKGLFTHIRHSGSNSLRSDNVIGVTEDKEGGIWIRTNEGIDHLEIVTGKAANSNANPVPTFVFTQIISNDAFKATTGNTNTIPEVFVDSRNRVLLTTGNKIWEVQFSGGRRSHRLTERYSFTTVNSLYIALLLEDTINHSLYLKTNEIIRFPDGDFKVAERVYNSTNMLAPWAIDRSQRLWLPGTRDIVRINLPSRRIENIALEGPDVVRALSYGSVFYTDRTGVVWIGTGGYGILKYAAGKEQFHHILPGTYFYQLLKSSEGRVVTSTFQNLTIKKGSPAVANPLMSPDVKKKSTKELSFLLL